MWPRYVGMSGVARARRWDGGEAEEAAGSWAGGGGGGGDLPGGGGTERAGRQGASKLKDGSTQRGRVLCQVTAVVTQAGSSCLPDLLGEGRVVSRSFRVTYEP